MKKLINYITLSWTGIFLIAACSKLETELPPREISPEIAEIADQYREILTGAPEGWVLAYQPDQYDETIYFHIDFKDENLMDVTAGYRGYHTPQTDIGYDFEGSYIPVISFAGENVFQELAEQFNGSSRFKIFYDEDTENFELVRADGYDDVRFSLRKATAALLDPLDQQIDAVLAQIAFEEEQARLSAETVLKVKEFAEIESSYYFYNLVTDQFSAEITAFDTVSREITLTYKEQPTSIATTITSNYSIYPKGIALDPVISVGTILIDSIELGTLDDPVLQITKAGNAGEGQMGYMHVPAFAYTNTLDRTVSMADWMLDQSRGGSNLFMYTADADSYYSDAVNFHRTIFGEYIDAHVDNANTADRLVNQMYFPANTASSRNIQISTRRISPSGNLFFLYRIDLDELTEGHSALRITLTEPASSIVPYQEEFDEYLGYQFPEEGVTVVPAIVGTTLRVRLVSRADSRFWVEYVLNQAANRTLRFD